MGKGSGDDKHTSTLSSLAWISSPLCVVTVSVIGYCAEPGLLGGVRLRYDSL